MRVQLSKLSLLCTEFTLFHMSSHLEEGCMNFFYEKFGAHKHSFFLFFFIEGVPVNLLVLNQVQACACCRKRDVNNFQFPT